MGRDLEIFVCTVIGILVIIVVGSRLHDTRSTEDTCKQEYTVMQNVCTHNKDSEVCDVAMMEYYNCTKSKETVNE